jgi:hypothetical protein
VAKERILMGLSQTLRLVLAGVAITLIGPQDLDAQGALLRVGDHVRIARFDASPLIGTLTLADAPVLEVLDLSGNTFSIPFAEIRTIERRLCTGCSGSSAVPIGTAIGFLAGGLFGAYVAHGLCENSDCGEVKAFFLGGLIGAAPGAALGGVVGSLNAGERWEVVPLGPGGNSSLSLAIFPTHGGRAMFGVRLGL